MNIEAYYLEVIHFEYNPPSTNLTLSSEFMFGHVVGKASPGGIINAVKFRHTYRLNSPEKGVLSMVAEQNFKFMFPLSELSKNDLVSIIKESYAQFEREFRKRTMSHPVGLVAEYPPEVDVENILNELKS